MIDRKHGGAAYRARYLFAAVFSTGVMMPVGYEYGYRTRLHVVETRPEAWEEPRFDLSRFIAEVHEMKAGVGALNEEGPQEQVALADGEAVTALLRRANDGRSWALTLINPDLHASRTARIEGVDVDLARTLEVTPGGHGHSLQDMDEVVLDPGQVRVFAGSAEA